MPSQTQPSVRRRIRYSIGTFWNGVPTNHPPINFMLEGNSEELTINVEAPFFDDPPPPGGKPGQAYTHLYKYEGITEDVGYFLIYRSDSTSDRKKKCITRTGYKANISTVD